MLQLTSSDSVITVSINRNEALARLEAIGRNIRAKHPEVTSIRIFGSLARGDQVGTSDIDVLVVFRGTERGDPLERIREFYPFFDLTIPVDLLVFSEAEIARRVASGDTWFMHIWNESLELTP